MLNKSKRRGEDIAILNNCGVIPNSRDNDADNNDNDLYDCYVTKLADNCSGDLISNGHHQHAQSIIRNIFSHADKKVRIFTSALSPEIYKDPRVTDAARAFLSRDGTSMDILLQHGEKLKRDLEFFKFCSENTNQCTVKNVVDSTDKSLTQHMVVMDKIGYRFCTDPDLENHIAIASFNAPPTAKNLADQFDILFERAEKFS